MSDQTAGIWLPTSPKTAFDLFGSGSPESAFLSVVTKAPTTTIEEINDLAAAMGLTVSLRVEKKLAGEKP